MIFFYNKYKGCKECNIKRVLKRFCNIKDDMLQKRRYKYTRFIELDYRLKALKENFVESN